MLSDTGQIITYKNFKTTNKSCVEQNMILIQIRKINNYNVPNKSNIDKICYLIRDKL
jgi:hypothetical protein